jgi:tripartite-type tricarboxylate transporter receptor subunit TctC
MLEITRRGLLGAATVSFAGRALAAYPEKPVRIIVPWNPGALADVVMRALAQAISGPLGQPVVIENRPGANGAVGTQAVKFAPPDGHTLALGNAETHAINPLIYPKLAYDPVADFAPICLFAKAPFALVVGQHMKVNDVAGFTNAVRAAPGKITFASWGVGSTSHLTMELLIKAAKLEMLHVPYTGQAPGITAVMGGHTDAMFLTAGGAEAAAKDGKVVLLAVSAEERIPLLPNTPTLKEAGIPVEGGNWFGLLGPARMPDDARTRLAEVTAEAARKPEVAEVFRVQAASPAPTSPDEFRGFIAQDRERWAAVVRDLNIKLE